MQRPYIIIHTHTSIDGGINSMELPEFTIATQCYLDLGWTPSKQVFNFNAYLNGRKSTEDNMTHYQSPSLDPNAATVPNGDFDAIEYCEMYYISLDARGELAWQDNTVNYGVPAHIIEVLTEQANNSYKAYLREKKISYIIAGKMQIDIPLMLDKLYKKGIHRLAIGGGGTINWSFIQQGLVDEVSMILAPIANGDSTQPRFFTAQAPYTEVKPVAFDLIEVQELQAGVIWLRYRVKSY